MVVHQASVFLEAEEDRRCDTPAARYARGDFKIPPPADPRHVFCRLCEAFDSEAPLSCPRADVDQQKDCPECVRTARRYYRHLNAGTLA